MVSTSHMKIHEITENIYNLLQNSKHSRLELKKPQAHKYVCLLNNDFIRTEFLENRNRPGSTPPNTLRVKMFVLAPGRARH